jgi:hypothetical protein
MFYNFYLFYNHKKFQNNVQKNKNYTTIHLQHDIYF